MGKKFRYRIKGGAQGRNIIPKGGSSSSNPVSKRHREAAKALRLVHNYPLIAVDDRLDTADQLISQLPIGSINLDSKSKSNIGVNDTKVQSNYFMPKKELLYTENEALYRKTNISSTNDPYKEWRHAMETLNKTDIKNGYDDKAVILSSLETIRRYVNCVPTDVLLQYADTAVINLVDEKIDVSKKERIADIIAMIIPGLNTVTLQKILQTINSWFVDSKWQKKSYRILSEIYKRINDTNLHDFFVSKTEFLNGMLQYDIKKVVSGARMYRIGIISNLSDYEVLSNFCKTVVCDLINSMDSALGMRTRTQATKCFQEMCVRLIYIGSPVDVSPSEALENVLNKIIEYVSPQSPNVKLEEIPLPTIKSGLIALNIFAQKQIKLLNGCLMNKLINAACNAISDVRVRALVLRLLRILCLKLPDFALQQFRETLLNTIFSQSLENNTLKVRKENRILAKILVEKFSKESLEKLVTDAKWIKIIKNAEKKLNKQHKKSNSMNEDQMEDDTVSHFTTATSHMTSTKTDALFDLFNSDDEENEYAPKYKSAKSIVLKEGDEDDLVDLLDKKSVHTSTISSIKKNNSENKEKNIFKFTKDGRLIIEDIDDDAIKIKKKPRKPLLEEDVNEEEFIPIKSKSRIDGDDSENETKMAYKPGGKGIHRKLNKSMGDHKKKEERYEPYAYIPMSKKNNPKGTLRSILKKKNRNSTKVKKRVNF